ncbi:MAG: hypothetical protein WBF71_00890, partial [Microthrixaceae bacterium]
MRPLVAPTLIAGMDDPASTDAAALALAVPAVWAGGGGLGVVALAVEAPPVGGAPVGPTTFVEGD